MLLPSRKAFSALLKPDSVHLRTGQEGATKKLNLPGDFTSATNALMQLLEDNSERAPKSSFLSVRAPSRLQITIAQDWVRCFICQWQEGIESADQMIKFAGIEFERRFALPSSDWVIETQFVWPGRSSLFIAMHAEHFAYLNQQITSRHCTLNTLTPYAFAELPLAFKDPTPSKSSTVVFGSAGVQRSATLVTNEQIQQFAMLPSAVCNPLAMRQLSEQLQWPELHGTVNFRSIDLELKALDELLLRTAT